MSGKVYSIDEIKKKTKNTLKKYEVKKAILFGSYAKNLQTSKSDIDIVIDSQGKLININFYGLLEELSEDLDKNVDLIELSEIKENSPIYENIEKEGVVLYEEQR